MTSEWHPPGFKKATKEELELFIKDYPNTLTYDWTNIPDPPVERWIDFTLNKGSIDGMVAMIFRDDYHGMDKKYFVLEDKNL
jgi:hypothetical protein